MNTRLCIAAALLVSACAPVQWVKPEASPEQAAQDARFCESEASREATLHVPRSAQAMTPGSYAPTDDGMNNLVETSRLTSFCMRSKGYALVPATRYARAPEEAKDSAAGASAPKE